jgi:ribokinase
MTYDIITFGSATVDIFADTFDRKHLTKDEEKMRYENKISYRTGDKILIRKLRMTIGGGGTNTALTFKRFGFNTAFCGCVGADASGGTIKAFLHDNKIGFVGHQDKEPSGLSIVLDSIEHDRTILTHKGANNCLALKPNDSFKDAKLFYFSSLLQKSVKTHTAMVAFAEKNDIKTAFNPSLYQVSKGYKPLLPLLTHTHYLILNKEEAQALCESSTPHTKELLSFLKTKIDEQGIVVITDGAHGADAFDGGRFLHIDSKKVKVVESTGAGDAFASAFVAAIVKGAETDEALKLAMANSQSVITAPGAKEKILTWNEALKTSQRGKYLVSELK